MPIQLGLVIDQERCIGCEACTVACKNENNGSVGFIRVKTEHSAQKDIPHGTFPNVRMTFMPLVCNHCDNPPCAAACPIDAIEKRSDGIVVLDRESCDGCQNCLEACPYGAISFDTENTVAEKCNLCVHRIENGLDPFCVICCEGQAIYYGNLTDPNSPAGRLASNETVFSLKPELATAPTTRYCPPKEPRGI